MQQQPDDPRYVKSEDRLSWATFKAHWDSSPRWVKITVAVVAAVVVLRILI